MYFKPSLVDFLNKFKLFMVTSAAAFTQVL
jgi:hypothetical protein